MKKIILILFVVLSFADAQTYTSTYKLPQWSVGDTLKVRTKNDSTQANIGLNYAFYRLEAILSRYIKSDGRFSGIGGYGSGNLDINAGTASATPVRVNIQDSLYVQYNTQIERDLLVQGNITVGGYIITDSIIVSGINGLIIDPSDSSTQRGINFKSSGYTYWTLYTPTNHSFRWLNGDATNVMELSQGGNLTVTGTTTLDTLVGNIYADSIRSNNVFDVLYSDTKIAGSSAGDTSANFTTFINTTSGNETKVRLTYVHRAGVKYVKGIYQIKGTVTASVGSMLRIYNMSGTQILTSSKTNTATSTYATDTNSLDVSGLTPNTLYELRFITFGITPGDDIPTTKNVTILSTSN